MKSLADSAGQEHHCSPLSGRASSKGTSASLRSTCSLLVLSERGAARVSGGDLAVRAGAGSHGKGGAAADFLGRRDLRIDRANRSWCSPVIGLCKGRNVWFVRCVALVSR